MTEPVLLEERVGAVAVLTLNRPQAMNALSAELRRALAAAFRRLAADRDVRVAVLTGRGRAFCAGLDLKELSSGGGIAALGLGREDDLEAAILSFDRPLIGAINGAAVTGGLELALMCDFLIASADARFADTHTRVAVTPSWGMSQRLPRLIGLNRAREMSFTARFVSAAEALQWGLVNRIVEPAAALVTETLAVAAGVAAADPDTVRNYKRLFEEGSLMSMGDALRFEKTIHTLTAHRATAEHVARARETLLAKPASGTTKS